MAHKKVGVRLSGDVVWTSPKDLRVQQALSCDIDHDGQDELVLLCWRIGRYGKSKPFWVDGRSILRYMSTTKAMSDRNGCLPISDLMWRRLHAVMEQQGNGHKIGCS